MTVSRHDCAHIYNNNNSGHNHTRTAIYLMGNKKLRKFSEGLLLVIAEQKLGYVRLLLVELDSVRLACLLDLDVY